MLDHFDILAKNILATVQTDALKRGWVWRQGYQLEAAVFVSLEKTVKVTGLSDNE